jgi:hypothetical protein
LQDHPPNVGEFPTKTRDRNMGMYRLRHVETGEMRGPFDEDNEYSEILLSEEMFLASKAGSWRYTKVPCVCDKNMCPICKGDLIAIDDNAPVEVIEESGTLGVMFENGFEELTEELASIYEVCR